MKDRITIVPVGKSDNDNSWQGVTVVGKNGSRSPVGLGLKLETKKRKE